MRRLRSGAAFVVAGSILRVVACSSFGPTTKSSAPPAPVVVHGSIVHRGTRLRVELEQGLGKHSTVGQIYTAKVVQPVLDDKGGLVIPGGSRVVGHVKDVRKGSGNTPATIHLTVDTLQVRGVNRPLRGKFVSVEPHAHKEVESGAEHGAERGALTGLVRGGPPGMLVGSLIGATTGTVISLGRASGESLPQGTTLTLQIDRSIPVATLRNEATG